MPHVIVRDMLGDIQYYNPVTKEYSDEPYPFYSISFARSVFNRLCPSHHGDTYIPSEHALDNYHFPVGLSYSIQKL